MVDLEKEIQRLRNCVVDERERAERQVAEAHGSMLSQQAAMRQQLETVQVETSRQAVAYREQLAGFLDIERAVS